MDSTRRWHNLVWDEEKIARFWSVISDHPPWNDEFFSKQVGAGVVNFLKRLIPIQGRALDYGCGPGYLLEHLLAAGMRSEGVDFSETTVETVNRRFRGHGAWQGARVSSGEKLPYPDETFDLVTCLETVEHVQPEKVQTLMSDLRRVLKPETGMLLVTVPNSEKLIARNVYCPECGSVFHRYQHLSSFDINTLEKLMIGFGFRTFLCGITDFDAFQRRRFPGLLDWTPRETYRWLRWAGAALMDTACWPGAPAGGRSLHQTLGRGGHLFWLGSRNEGSIRHGD